MKLDNRWQQCIDAFFESEEGKNLSKFLEERKRVVGSINIFPPEPLRALFLLKPEDIKVVILGQDPYHGEGQANGLAFSVKKGIKIPPSLRNIYKEIIRSHGGEMPVSGDLTYLARQGVLLLNTTLTVEKGHPASHSKKGWETFTDLLITFIARRKQPTIYMLWGKFAQSKKQLIIENSSDSEYLILESNHPSPLSATKPPVPFIGNNHFLKANKWLVEHGQHKLNWLPEQNQDKLSCGIQENLL